MSIERTDKLAKMDLFNVLKINTSYIMSNDKSMRFTLRSAKELGMMVALGDNQLLRFIRQIQERPFDKEYIQNLYSKRNHLKQLNESNEHSNEILEIQKEIENLLFVPEIVSVKVDTTKKDYKDLCKNGFTVTVDLGDKTVTTHYIRLCAGAGQLRRNSAIFVDSSIHDLLERTMMCGLTRQSIGKINLAKFSAYFALYTSATRQVRKPRICVVNDFEYTLKDQNIKWIYDNPKGEKDVQDKIMDFEINAFDGAGMISPEMAKLWQEDLKLDYLPASFILRSCWIKGLVSIFDFHKFAKEVAHKEVITDLWGVEYNIDDIDVILTKSQFKMAKKYENWQQYMYYHQKFNHIFGVARVTKKQNNIYTPMNYQYIQSNKFTEESIKQLADFSLDWIKKIMTGDKLYSMLFLLGSHDEDDEYTSIEKNQDSSIAKALMYNDTILNDSYIRNKINLMLEKKVRQTKIGKLLVEGSYDFSIPDLYALCEHALGMEVHGLLGKRECWNKRWVDKGTNVVALMRSPLVDFSENQKCFINHSDECKEWFKYIYSGNILNIWGMEAINASDADYD